MKKFEACFAKSFILESKDLLTKETTHYTQMNNLNFCRRLFDLSSIYSH